MSVAFLSNEWIDAANELLRAVMIDPPVSDPGFSVETVIIGEPFDGSTGYVIDFVGSSMSARRPTPGEPATVRLTQRYEIAAAVAQGALSAQAAFLAADIQVGGDVSVLIGNAGLIAQLGDVLAPLRRRTTYTGNSAGVPSDRGHVTDA